MKLAEEAAVEVVIDAMHGQSGRRGPRKRRSLLQSGEFSGFIMASIRTMFGAEMQRRARENRSQIAEKLPKDMFTNCTKRRKVS